MAVTQISRIQHRRGLQQDLPQLASAEFGWSVDTQKLYIGNGTLEEGAPKTGVTEILTTNSITNIASLLGTYSFVGDVAGYAAQTGTSLINPTVRSYQQKLDDVVNIKDFGAKGNNIDDDTDAINRALQQIYRSDVTLLDQRTRRTIYFPGGTYLITTPIKIPPYARLIGDGTNATTIKINSSSQPMVILCDSKFLTGTSMGTTGGALPTAIEISGMSFTNVGTNIQYPILIADSARDVVIHYVSFISNITAGYYPNVVSITSNVGTPTRLFFDSCGFINGGNGVAINGSANSLRISNSTFEALSNTGVILSATDGFTGISNYYGNLTSAISSSGSNKSVSIGDYHYSTNGNISSVSSTGLSLGNLRITDSKLSVVSATPTVIPITGNVGVKLNYDISNTSSKRFGSLVFSVNSTGSSTFTDEYVETGNSFAANIFVTPTSLICTIHSGTANMKYNYQVFE